MRIVGFKMKYEIQKKYLTSGSKRRRGLKADKIRFVVAHDTGNPNSTALGNVNYYESSRNEIAASAHIFVDDKNIIECIPALTGTPEKAWHVLYNVTTDNKMFGANANDAAIGIEMCYGSNFNKNKDEVYKRFIWVTAYTCYKFGLDPKTKVTGHFILDPARKIDPKNGLSTFGITWDQYLKDVVKEYNECINDNAPVVIPIPTTPNLPVKDEDKPMTPEEKKAFDELKETVKKQSETTIKYQSTVDELKSSLTDLTKKQTMTVPKYAEKAVYDFKKMEYEQGKFVLDTPNGRSSDFYAILTVVHRVFKALKLIK